MDSLSALRAYVPDLIARRAHTGPPDAPAAERMIGAVLFADITGFTALAERLAARGPEGAETLTQVLEPYFETLIARLYAHGGDVVKFTGDGVLALWRAEDENEQGEVGVAGVEPVVSATLRAVQCALEIQSVLHDYVAAEDIRLALRIAISAGTVDVLYLGGVFQRWEVLVTGAPLAEVGHAEPLAQPGEVMLAAPAWALARPYAQGVYGPTPDAPVRVERLNVTLAQRALVPAALTAAEANTLSAYIPQAIRTRLAAGQLGWLSELRRVTVLFVNLPDFASDNLDHAQAVLHALQGAVYRYEGSLNKLLVDDKGTILVAALGLPPFAHEDDARRGVQTALEMHARLSALGERHTIGLAAGRVFCGALGSATRREYTILGDVVNLAARLMQAAGRPGAPQPPILCDAALAQQAAHLGVALTALAPITVKGKSEPLVVYTPTAEGVARAPVRAERQADIVGRVAEQAQFAEAVAALRATGAGRVFVVVGEAGIGKSRLVEAFLMEGRARACAAWLGAGDAVERTTAYFAWRAVFMRVLGLDEDDSAETCRARVADCLGAADDDLRALFPLLNAVLPGDWPETPATAVLSGQVRAENTRRILLTLLSEAARVAPAVLVLEDAHWLDSASWALALALVRLMSGQSFSVLGAATVAKPALLVVLVTRPPSDPVPAEYGELQRSSLSVNLVLAPLPAAEIEVLLCRRLGVAALPASVAELIRRKAEGHPFFSEELAYALRDSGVIQIEPGEHGLPGRCTLAAGEDVLGALSLPDTVEGVITSRIDRLTPSQQLALKVASVIGRVFALRVLQDIYPVRPEQAAVPDYLAALERLDITPLETPEPDLAYIFKHIITQEVAYNLMLFAQRRELHRAAAEWHEREHAHDLEPLYPLLAFHWGRAEEHRKALDYLVRAGEQAVRNGAYQEARRFFEDALQLVESAQIAVEPWQRGHWERLLGEALVGLGLHAQSRVHLTRAVEVLGYAAPVSARAWAPRLAQQAVRQVWHRLRRADRLVEHADETARLLEAVRAYERLGEMYYFGQAPIRAIYCSVYGMNLAEKVPPSAERARLYANVSVAAGLLGLHGAARTYVKLGMAIVAEQADLHARARVLAGCSVYHASTGDWEQCRVWLTEARQIWEQLGDYRRWEETAGAYAWITGMCGELDAASKYFEQLFEVAQRVGDQQYQITARAEQANLSLRAGRIADARGYLDEVEGWLAHSEVGLVPKFRAYGALTQCALQMGELATARRWADATLDGLRGTRLMALTATNALTTAADLYLSLCEQEGAPSEWVRRAREAAKHVASFKRVFPFYTPIGMRIAARAAQVLERRPQAAQALLRKSVEEAHARGMRYEEGLAWWAQARLAEGAEARAEAERQAVACFSASGAPTEPVYHLAKR